MKFSSSALFAALFLTSNNNGALASHHCTHGKLYISDVNSTTIHIFDVSNGLANDLTAETTIDVPGGPDGDMALNAPSNGVFVTAMYRGDEAQFFSDGVVSWIDTGVRLEDHGDHDDVIYVAPSLVDNAQFECARAIHYTRHNGHVAIFCDGSIFAMPQINSTVWLIDESKLGTSDSPIIHTTTLPGSHHGVAIPIDDGHLLHSIALDERIAGDSNTTSLPSTFQVVDYEGNILHAIADTASPDTSCSGFHGEAAQTDQFALACDADHGGILAIDYTAPSMSYTSRAIAYPSSLVNDETRSSTLGDHHDQQYIVGNFRGTDSFHLMAFLHSDTEVQEDHVLSLGTEAQCGFAYEVGSGDVVLVLMPTGMLHAFEVPEWQEIASVQVTEENMVDCDDVYLIPGVGQAFILRRSTQTLYAVDLEHIHHEGEGMEVFSLQLDFTPYVGIVGGIPPENVCTMEEHSPHSPTSAPPGPSPSATSGAETTVSMIGGGLALVGMFFHCIVGIP